MKVSILTYHWEDSYGAAMQAYATYKAVESLGHIPEFIDLRLPEKNNSLISKIVFSLKRYRFNAFRRKYFKNLTSRTYYSCRELKENPPVSDCYLVGSDQTWNPQIAKELLPAFFLDFGSSNQKKVTYATSIGLNVWEGSEFITDEKITKLLDKFSKILLREESAIDICRNKFGHDAEQVIDPVLLFPRYPELTGPVKSSGEIITYKLIDNPNFYNLCREFANSKNLPIRSVGSIRHPKGYRFAYPETVGNWIKRFATAEFVLTDSFHGMVFSLLYHRPFIIYIADPKRVTRMKSLLSILGLENRILENATLGDVIRLSQEKIDWSYVDEKLSLLRGKSFERLREAVES